MKTYPAIHLADLSSPLVNKDILTISWTLARSKLPNIFLAYTDHVWSSDLNKRMFSFKRIRDDSGSGWKQANISFSYIFVLDPSNYMSVRLGRRAGS